MKETPIVFMLLVILSCNKIEKNTLNSNVQIIVKYKTLDEWMSPNHIKCSNKIKEFKKMGKYDCSFQLENSEFDIEEKFILNKNGNIKEYWIYKPEGPLTYKIEELESDPRFLESIGGAELNIKLLENKQQILDKGDTLTIERIFLEEKLILIKQKGDVKKNGRRIFFEYI